MSWLQPADWGSVADWIAGIGAIVASLVALGIAVWQQRSIRKEQERRANEELEMRSQVIAEAIRLAGELEAEARNLASLMALGGTGASRWKDVNDAAAIVSEQAHALQRLTCDPRLFSELGRLAAESRIAGGTIAAGCSSQQIIAQDLAEKMQHRRETLAGLLAKRTPDA